MAKKEKVIDLKPEKITDEQLKKIQDTVNGMNRAQLEIGTMELKKHEMLHGISGLREELVVLQKQLEKDYCMFDVNTVNVTINYPENGEADKKN